MMLFEIFDESNKDWQEAMATREQAVGIARESNKVNITRAH